LVKPTLTISVGLWHLLKQMMAFGNPTEGGYATVREALVELALLNKELKAKFGIVLPGSAHWWHQLLVPSNHPKVGKSAQFNDKCSIALPEWMEGVKSGILAPIGRIIPPGFGLPGSDFGALIHPDPERRQLHHDMLVLSMVTSMKVRKLPGCLGHVIYWTGPDGVRWRLLVQGTDVLLSYSRNPKLEEWRLIVGGLVGAIIEGRLMGCVDEKVLIEGKAGGDPCYLDVFTDTTLEVVGINEINDGVGAEVAEFQPETAHERGAGIRFCEALNIGIKWGVFGGNIHLNAGGLGQVNFAKLLKKPGGTPMSQFPQYVDNDFLPGEGPTEWVDDQVQSIGVCAKWSAETGRPVNIEFDARFSRYGDTMGKLCESVIWTIGRWDEQCKNLGLVA
jgi:hypothetical protein